MTERGKAIAVRKAMLFPSTKDPVNAPPNWLAKIIDSAAELERAGDLEALLHEVEPIPSRPRPAPGAPRSAPPRHVPWWHPFVMPAAIVCAALVLTHRGGQR